MNRLPKLLAFLGFALALLGGTRAAPAAEVRLAAYLVVPAAAGQPASRERLLPLKDVRPGDTVEYEASYINGDAQTARGVQLTVPVPAGGLALVSLKQAPAADSASLDGSRFAPLPLTRIETLADGSQARREVPLAEYRALRWNLGDVPAGSTRRVRARMHLPAVTALPDAAVSR